MLGALALLWGTACGEPADAVGTGGAGREGTVAGSSAVSGGSPNAGGASASGGVPVTIAGSGQALGGGDQGSFFPQQDQVPIMPPDAVGGGGGSGGAGIPGDGNVFVSKLGGGDMNGTAKFTQRGEDVDLELDMTRCPDGQHRVTIRAGFSCDNPDTKGPVWERSGDIGGADGVVCSGGKGTLRYTRSGADKSRNWTVGDHVVATDLTAHVVIIGKADDPNSLDCCGNFF